MQTVLNFNPSAAPLLIGLISLPATAIIAALSWNWVERTNLAHKAASGNGLQSVWDRYKTAASTAKGE